MQVPVSTKPAVWGVVVGSIATMIIGFSALGWTLNSTTQKVAQDRTDLAVTAALTPFCVQSYMKQPDAIKNLAALRETDSWKRSDVVEKGGWATMPGSKEAAPGVAIACADALVKAKV